MGISLDEFKEEFGALLAEHPGVELGMSALTAWCVMATIQLACRHPEFSGPTREIAERVARGLQAQFSTSPVLAALAEAGWDSDC